MKISTFSPNYSGESRVAQYSGLKGTIDLCLIRKH